MSASSWGLLFYIAKRKYFIFMKCFFICVILTRWQIFVLKLGNVFSKYIRYNFHLNLGKRRWKVNDEFLFYKISLSEGITLKGILTKLIDCKYCVYFKPLYFCCRAPSEKLKLVQTSKSPRTFTTRLSAP